MVNPKAAIPQLVNAIKRKITECQDYATDYEAKPWNAFVESNAVELLGVLKEKQRNFETRWQNEFEAQLDGDDWEKLSEEVEKTNDAIDKARDALCKWIHSKRTENVPNRWPSQRINCTTRGIFQTRNFNPRSYPGRIQRMESMLQGLLPSKQEVVGGKRC